VFNFKVVGAVVSGYAATNYNESNSPEGNFLVVKLVVCGFIFLVMFSLFPVSASQHLFVTVTDVVVYISVFSFLMNVKEVSGCKMNLKVIYKIFHATHYYYAPGPRLTNTAISYLVFICFFRFEVVLCNDSSFCLDDLCVGSPGGVSLLYLSCGVL
jgi:hypothetical protein